ncbi:sensor histidine kinase [Nocardioides sp.]|uniref:sensor histidine kinase n=1 Tax=Nocardioides sp. TaxID=35761 RepID=UPI00356AC1D6
MAPLISNAARVADTIRIDAELVGSMVHLTVTDNGSGVSSEIRDDLFTPGRTSGPGAGLGLALARRVARTAGGDVDLHAPGGPDAGGAAFRVSLPGHRLRS